MSSLFLDLRSALRGLARDRAFTLFSVLALALGLGLNGSLLVLSRAFLLRPAPVTSPETIVEVLDDTHDGSREDRIGSTTAYAAVRELPEFQAVAIAPCRTFEIRWRTGESFRQLRAADASAEYLEVIGIRPFLGRGFLPTESGPTGDGKVVMVSHRFWKETLGGLASVLGSTLTINGEPRMVVGVLPPGFEGHRLDLGIEVLMSSKVELLPAMDKGRFMTGVLAKIRPGVSLEQVRRRLRSLPWHSDLILDVHPYESLPPMFGARMVKGLGLLHGAGFLILGIALCNVLALQSARLHKRRSELALRIALGAARGDIFRLLLIEHLVLTSLAGLAALLLSAISTPFLEALQAVLPYPPEVHVDLGLWSAGVTFGLAQALSFPLVLVGMLQTRCLEPTRTLREAGFKVGTTRARGALVAVQVALSLVLLSAAALSLRDLSRQLDIPLGYALEDRFQLSCDPRGANRPWSDLSLVMPILRERLAALPGVKMTALSVGGAPMVKGVTHRNLGGRVVLCTHELPSLLGLKPLEGRNLERIDEDQGRVLMGTAMIRKLKPESPLLGNHTTPSGELLDVVGVIRPLSLDGPTKQATAVLFKPVSRVPQSERFPFDTLTVHAPGSPKATLRTIRTLAREVLGDLPYEFDSLEALRAEKLAQPHRLLILSVTMGALALLLSLCGLYGLAAHLAEARRCELAIRVALGASTASILAELASGFFLPLVSGLIIGVSLSLTVSRLLMSQITDFVALDVTLLVLASLALILAAFIACLLPAFRSTRVSPAVGLRLY